MDLLQRIQHTRDTLRPSERKVADYILDNPAEVIHLRIVDLAAQAHVSEPTVVRFCRAVGCDGFQAFKLALAQGVAQAPGAGPFVVSADEGPAEFSPKVFNATIDTLAMVRDALATSAVEAAIAAIAAARRVEFYGFGASAAVASDAQHKFFRLRVSSAAYADPHIQTMSALSLSEADVVIAISQSGRTRDLLDAMQRAREAGATVIALAPADTPVARRAGIAIPIDVEEEFEIYTPLSSRIAHLVVIDVLAVGVAQRKGPEIIKHLKKLRRGLRPLRTSG